MTNKINEIRNLLTTIEGNATTVNEIHRLLNEISIYNTQKAISQLSFSELEAAKAIFKNNEIEQNIIASNIAEANNITKSIIVSVLKKLESGGAIISKSKGVKGMYIKVLDDKLFDILKNLE